MFSIINVSNNYKMDHNYNDLIEARLSNRILFGNMLVGDSL